MNKKTLLRIAVALVLTVTAVFVPGRYSIILFAAAYLTVGADVVVTGVRNLFSGQALDENFLMTVSTVAAFCIGENIEAVAIMLFYQVGELFQKYAVDRSRRSVAELMDICPESVTVVKNGEMTECDPEDVEIGDIFVVKTGERIAVDGVVFDGNGLLDTSSVTGESLPVSVSVGDTAVSGSINIGDPIYIKAAARYENSTVAKVLELVENAASKKAKTERFITRFARVYTPCVVILALIIAVLPSVITGEISKWLYRAIIFLVVSCPCALVVSVPMAFFGGIGSACRKGVLIKGSDCLEKLAKVNMAAFDKTGTLTTGKFKISGVFSRGVDEDTLISLTAAAESLSNHPIAEAFLSVKYDKSKFIPENYSEVGGMGISVSFGKDKYFFGRKEWLEKNGITLDDKALSTAVYAAVNGEYIGHIELIDELKPNAFETVQKLSESGIKTVMLTGDNQVQALRTAKNAGIEECHSGMLPQDKAEYIENSNSEYNTMFVGDGINDAPTLAVAYVGVSMGSLGSDSAVEISDAVIMNDDISKIPEVIAVSKRTVRKVKENIVFSLAVKGAVLLLGAFGLVGAPAAVFADVGVMVLAVLNAMFNK